MKFGPNYREPVRVLFHQNAGFTRVEYLRTGQHVEVPTETIPTDLREIGSRFILIFRAIRPDAADSQDAMHHALAYNTSVERIDDGTDAASKT